MSGAVRIPADIDREDRVVANLTIRQLVILAVTGLLLYCGWLTARPVLPLAVYLILAIPVGVIAAVVALGQRDGVSLDRLLLAAIRQHLQPRHRVSAPDGVRPAPVWLTTHITSPDPARGGAVSPAPLRLPAETVSDTGVIDLGADGLAVVAVASTVNFALRTVDEQQALVSAFGNYLHSQTAPLQVLVRAERLDLSGQIEDLLRAAPSLPHPQLEAAAREHATYLRQLSQSTDLLRRQILLVLREPLRPLGTPPTLNTVSPLTKLRSRRNSGEPVDDGARRAAETRLGRRLQEAIELLAPAGIVVTALDAGQATAVLAAACNPDRLLPPDAELAGTHDVITLTDTPVDEPLVVREPALDTAEDDWEGLDQ